jgi:hypothetical protein
MPICHGEPHCHFPSFASIIIWLTSSSSYQFNNYWTFMNLYLSFLLLECKLDSLFIFLTDTAPKNNTGQQQVFSKCWKKWSEWFPHTSTQCLQMDFTSKPKLFKLIILNNCQLTESGETYRNWPPIIELCCVPGSNPSSIICKLLLISRLHMRKQIIITST